MTTLRGELKIDVQTLWKEQLRDIDTVRKKRTLTEQLLNAEGQEKSRALCGENKAVRRQASELRSEIDQIGERLHLAEGELLRVHIYEDMHRKKRRALRLELSA